MIDRIAIRDELFAERIEGSEITFIPFKIVDNYSGTTSDHLPVKVRFELIEPIVVSASEDQQVYFGHEPEACTTLSASATGGKGTLTYSWSTGETGQSIKVCPSESQVYTITVSDKYGNRASEEVYVCVKDESCINGIGQEKVELCHTVGRWNKQVSLIYQNTLFLSSSKEGLYWAAAKSREPVKGWKTVEIPQPEQLLPKQNTMPSMKL